MVAEPPQPPPTWNAWPPHLAPPIPPPSVQVVRHTLRTRTWVWLVVLVALIAGVVGSLVGATVGINQQQTIVKEFFPTRSVIPGVGDIQAILAKVEPAVVSVDSQAAGANGLTSQAAGTGMILTSNGEVLTNNHVVAGAASVTVTLLGQSKARPAHVLGTDPAKDVALVQIDDASNLPTVTLGQSSDAQVGDSVVAIGNALALAGGPTVTQGIISAENRSLTAENDHGGSESLSGLFQTDAAINPGNSGGPLVNAQAQVVAMNTAVASSSSGNAPTQNIGFAIPVDSIKPLLPGLRTGGTGGTTGGVSSGGSGNSGPAPSRNKAFLGVTVAPVTPSVQQQEGLSVSSGALVLSVEPGGPAAKGSVQAGDVIVSFNGKVVTSAAQLTADIRPLAPGDHVALGVVRGTRHLTLHVTLGANPNTR